MSVDGRSLTHIERFQPMQDMIDLSGLPSGTLLVRVRNAEGEASIRIVRVQ